MVGMIFVRKIIHLATKIFGSTNFNHSTAELFISYKSVMDTLEVLLLALLLELMGDVVFLVSRLFTVSVSVRSFFLYIVVRNRKEVHRVLDEFLILPHVQLTMPMSQYDKNTLHCVLVSVPSNSHSSMFPTS